MIRAIQLAVTCVAVLIATAGQVQAAFILSIDNYTADELTFSIAGFFDADTIGDSEGYLALKNDWSNNRGVHTELFSSTPIVTSNTVLIGGLAPTTFLQNGTSAWMDNIYFHNPLGTENPILAGTTVAGSVTLSGVGAFNPAVTATFELVSGFVRPFGPGPGDDWARLEAGTLVAAVPEPSSLAVFGIGACVAGLGAALRRRREKQQVATA